MVDSNDRERITEAKDELDRMLNEDELRSAILLVFANKQVCNNLVTAQKVVIYETIILDILIIIMS